MKNYILSLDLGTSGLKMLLCHIDGQHQVDITKDYPTYYPLPGYVEQDPRDWWKAVCEGIPELILKAGIQASDIIAVGVDGIGWTPVMIAQNGQVLGRAALWNDTRATQECLEISRLVDEEHLFKVSGNPNQPYYSTPKIMWYRKHEPERFKQLKCIVSSNSFLVWKLTNHLSQDMSQGYGWAFYDIKHGMWNQKIAEDLGFDLCWMPELLESMQVAGTVSKESSNECGLVTGTPVIAGGLDAACGVLGAGIIDPGPAQEQSGSAGGMSICTDYYCEAPDLIAGRHVIPQRWLVQGGTVGGGGVLKWLSRNLYPEEWTESESDRMAEFNHIIQEISPGSEGVVFLPYMAGERSPIWNPTAKGVYYGLDFSKSRGHLVRAVLEGVAYSLKHNLECAAQYGLIPSELRAVGGASTSSVWMQIKADITGHSIRAVSNPNATAVGCSMLAAVGCGAIKRFDEACERFVSLQPHYFPQNQYRDVYDNGFAQYRILYDHLKNMMKG